jgi:hypothetical protein
MSETDCKVPVEKLRWVCDPALFGFKTTDEIANRDGSIGQERALASIDFGLGMTNNGFNLYLAGESGTGRSSTISNLLKKRAKDSPAPSDWCYVHNFETPDVPVALPLPAGKGSELAADMRELLEYVRANIRKPWIARITRPTGSLSPKSTKRKTQRSSPAWKRRRTRSDSRCSAPFPA